MLCSRLTLSFVQLSLPIPQLKTVNFKVTKTVLRKSSASAMLTQTATDLTN